MLFFGVFCFFIIKFYVFKMDERQHEYIAIANVIHDPLKNDTVVIF